MILKSGICTKVDSQVLFADIKATYEAAAARYINLTRQQPPDILFISQAD